MSVHALIVGALSIAGAGGYILLKWSRRGSTDYDEQFRFRILREAAVMVQNRMGGDAVEIEKALSGRVAARAGVVDSVMRVECAMTKTSASQCDCKVVVAVASDGQVMLLTMTESHPWEELPKQVRRDFLRNAGQPQTYVMFEHETAEQKEAH